MRNKITRSMYLVPTAMVFSIFSLGALAAKQDVRNNPNAVSICHVEGARHAADFVTFYSEYSSGGNPQCDREGGHVITVSPQACEKGHKAEARYTILARDENGDVITPRISILIDCENGDLQPLSLLPPPTPPAT